MKAIIDKNGYLEVFPENTTEAYALEKWAQEQPDCPEDSAVKLIVQVNIPE